jgi:hypothetical protein
MKRVIAVIAALAMIAGAIVFRRSSDGDGSGSGKSATVVVGCAAVIEDPCARWAAASGYTSTIIKEPPPIGSGAEAALQGIDVFVAPQPWASLASLGFPIRTGATEEVEPATVVASSPVVLVKRSDDSTVLTTPGVAWDEAIDADTRLWAEASWLAPVVEAGLVVSALAEEAKTSGEAAIPIDQLAGNDLASDAVVEANADFAAAQAGGNSSSKTASDAIGAMSAREIDVVATVKALAGNRTSQSVVTPTPLVTATIALTVRPDLGTTPNASTLTTELRAKGWDPPTTTGVSVGAKLLEGLAARL